MRILLIDDSTLSRNLLKRAINGDHQFFEAEDGIRGIELYYLERPDLVFLDLTMPGTGGLEVLEQLKRIDPEVRVIIGTADIQDFTRNQANELGAAAFLTKPFTPEVVQEVIEQVLRSSEG